MNKQKDEMGDSVGYLKKKFRKGDLLRETFNRKKRPVAC